MLDERMTELLKATAQELDDGISPLSHDFLVRHDVTSEECRSLADLLALGTRLMLHASADMKRGGIIQQAASLRIVEAMLL